MKNLTLEKIKDPKIQKQVDQQVGDLENFGRAAGDISEKLETMYALEKLLKDNPGLENSDPKLYSKINANLIKLKGWLLDFMTDEEVLTLIKKNLLDFIKYNIDFEDRLKNFLLDKSYKVRDAFLEKVRQSIEKNREELGDFILLGEKRAEVKGYLKNWVQDFNNILGKERHFKMDIAKYLFQSSNAKNLNAQDKKFLKDVLEFYEKTKIKVNEPFGLGAYPPEMFGVEVIGKEGSLKAKFKTSAGEELPEVGIEETTERPGEEVIPQEQEVISKDAWAKLEEEKSVDVTENQKITEIKKSQKPGITEDIERTEALKKGTTKTLSDKAPAAAKALADRQDRQKSKPSSISTPVSKQEIRFSLGSVDSIKKLTPDVFRRISSDPSQAAEKIKSEAAKLIQSNPENIIIAKEMWQQSDLYKSYLEIAKEGMDMGLSVDKVIDARGKMGKPTLSKKEFEAVVDLSKVF